MRRDFNDMFCSFCGKNQAEAKRLIVSPDGTSFICDECIKICSDILRDEDKHKGFSESIELLTPIQIKGLLDEYVVGQESAKQVLSVAVYNHYKRINYISSRAYSKNKNSVELEKSNVLLMGPTGSGKTLLAKTLARILQVPFAQVDATTLTETGYIGEDVESALQKLVQNANYDIKKAERGIVYIDEIDKIARRTESRSMHRDVGGEGVQQALLRIIEGTKSSIPPQGGRKHPYQEMLEINTDNILFIVGGAFVGVSDIIKKRLSGSGLGFGADVKTIDETQKIDYLKDIQPDDLVQFGLIPEFVGRIPVLVGLNELDEDALIKIMQEPKNAIIKQFKEMFKLDGIELEFDESGVRAIAQKAISLKTGARGLRTIVENCLLDIMFTAPNDKSIKKIVIDKDAIENKNPKIIKEETINNKIEVDDNNKIEKTKKSKNIKLTHKQDIQEVV